MQIRSNLPQLPISTSPIFSRRTYSELNGSPRVTPVGTSGVQPSKKITVQIPISVVTVLGYQFGLKVVTVFV